jgi:hypothetical protein
MTELQAARYRLWRTTESKKNLDDWIEHLETMRQRGISDPGLLRDVCEFGEAVGAELQNLRDEAREFGFDQYGEPRSGEAAQINQRAWAVFNALIVCWDRLLGRALPHLNTLNEVWLADIGISEVSRAQRGIQHGGTDHA